MKVTAARSSKSLWIGLIAIALAIPCFGQTPPAPTIPSRIRVEVSWSDPTWPYWYLNAFDFANPSGYYFQHATSCGFCSLIGGLSNSLANATVTNPAFVPTDPVNHPPFPLAIEISPLVPKAHYQFLLCRQSGIVNPNLPPPPPAEASVSVWIGQQRTAAAYVLPTDHDSCNTTVFDYTVPSTSPPASPQRFITAALATSATIERHDAATVTTLTVPLGSEFHVGFEQASVPIGPPTPATFTLDRQVMGAALGARTLFPNHVVFSFNSALAESTKDFLAVHLGSARLQIAPIDDPTHSITLAVNIVLPDGLGTSTVADPSINDAAHRSGLLPQMLKGQIAQESFAFNPKEFRYEPLRDVDTIRPRINSLPYSDYTAPDPSGRKLLDDDLSPREMYFFKRNGVTARIQSGDTNVTILEIYKGSNCIQVRQGRCHGANWSTANPALARLVAQQDPRLDENAQTPTASSYGWLQPMYYKAIEIEWQGILGEVHPSYLFDETNNLNARASSLYVGSDINVLNWHAAHHNHGEAPSFADYAEFERALRRMYHRYNPAWSSPQFPNYETAVIVHAAAYVPTRSGALLH